MRMRSFDLLQQRIRERPDVDRVGLLTGRCRGRDLLMANRRGPPDRAHMRARWRSWRSIAAMRPGEALRRHPILDLLRRGKRTAQARRLPWRNSSQTAEWRS